ncbi:SHOCT domain-containing protein [Neobacillus niacini]|uniref:SHOCT domain-containing protein n=1 Tax=Neobacillus niacini TaxID=86668 RepID=UPI002FFF870B
MGCLVGILVLPIGIALIAMGDDKSIWGIAIIIGGFFLSMKIQEWLKSKREIEKLEKSTEEEESLLKELESNGLSASQIFHDKMKLDRYIVFDENKKMILFVNSDNIRGYNYRDILQSKVLEDGREILDTTRSGATTGAVIGAALGGGIGAVVGGIVGAQDSSSRESVTVKVVVNDTLEPSFEIELLSRDIKGGEDYVYTQSETYKNAYKSAQYLHDKVSILIRQAEELNKMEKSEKSQDAPKVNGSSIADEIRKLAELKVEGLITEDEYENQKKRLMI